MFPFYLLVTLALLALLGLLWPLFSEVRTAASSRRVDLVIRPSVLSREQQVTMATIANAVGPRAAVLADIYLGHALCPDCNQNTRRQRRAERALRHRQLDFLVYDLESGRPLWGALVRSCQTNRRSHQCAQDRTRRIAEQAGFPLVMLPNVEGKSRESIRQAVADKIAGIDFKVRPELQQDNLDEEVLLSRLAAAMQAPDVFSKT